MARSRIAAVTALLLACASGPAERPVPDRLAPDALPVADAPRWPPAPGPERIRHLASLRDSGDLGASGGWLRRALELITGAERPRFVRPAAACTRGALLVVADPGAGLVHRIDLAQRSWRLLRGSGELRLASPVGVACLPDGRIVVADSVRERVVAFPASGQPAERFLREPLSRPTALAYDERTQRLWVAETLEHRLHAYDLMGRRLLSTGRVGSAAGEFNHPTWLATDAGGIWVADALNFRLQHVDEGGRPVAMFGAPGDRIGDFARPRGVAVGPHGRIFSVDALFDAVRIFDRSGQLLLAFGGRGSAAGEFWLPAGIALGEDGLIFVCDSYNSRVEIFRYRPPEGDAP